MPKMSHAIEGRIHPERPGTPTRCEPVRPAPAADWQNTPGFWKYASVKRQPGVMLLAIFVSVTLHVFVLYGFNEKPAPVRVVAEKEEGYIQMVLPDLKDLEEIEQVEALSDEAVQAPGVTVPSLVDMPSIVPVDAFVQPLDFHPPAELDPSGPKLTSIPVNFRQGDRDVLKKLGKIFDLSQLDRAPEAIVQVPPIFPPTLKREYPSAEVTVAFVVNSNGEVVAPYIVKGAHSAFEQAALLGVEKWKFRPGMKGGRRVNTRMQVEIRFRLTDGE